MDNRKIFITYASAGAGHMKAAEAVYKMIKKINPGADVRMFDSLDYTTPFYKKSYPGTYLFAITKTPTLWGFFYYFFDLPVVDFFVQIGRRILNSLHNKNFEKYILEENPDIVLTTHFLTTEVIGNLKSKGLYKGMLITIVTDYGLHSFWVHKNCDHYIVASEDAREDLAKRGIDKNRIYSLGIPVDEAFSKKQGKKAVRKTLEIKEDLFTILIVSGGFGVGPIRALVEGLGNLDIPIQLIVVCGKNPKLFDEITGLQKEMKNPMKVYGFATNMPQLMNASDLIITKSGGLSTSEALAMGLPMIIIRPVIGQETKNCAFLLRHNAAIRMDKAEEVKNIVLDLFNNKEKLEAINLSIKEISRPDSSSDIAKFVLSKAAK